MKYRAVYIFTDEVPLGDIEAESREKALDKAYEMFGALKDQPRTRRPYAVAVYDEANVESVEYIYD